MIFVYFLLVSRCFIDIFFYWYHVFIVTPYWLCFCFRQKGGEHYFSCFWPFCWFLVSNKKGEKNLLFCFWFYPFIDDWQKGGELFVSFYMHTYVFAYIKFNYIKFNWYLEHVLKISLVISLVSRTFYCLCISMHCHSLHIFMFICLCMS